jgi:hypothetical protein
MDAQILFALPWGDMRGRPQAKNGPEGPLNRFNFQKKTGAGEEIRTLDPNLGKVVLYP